MADDLWGGVRRIYSVFRLAADGLPKVVHRRRRARARCEPRRVGRVSPSAGEVESPFILRRSRIHSAA